MIDSTHTQINKSTTPEAEVLVRVEGVSKKFCKDLKRSLWYGIRDIASDLLGLKKNQELRKDEFWAVNDVSFELRRGECLGLIGHNGAGKSTLLKMLNGLINPDKGKITMKGRIGALIELGAGFNPILTGRENVFNNGAVLGFSQKEIAAKYKAIVEFAELEEFMDTPVQNYSSGMKVRLGFAVAAQMEPDVLIIDEVLAVGDVGFKIKCFNTISDLMGNSSVILVSHSMPQITRICNSLLFLGKGKVIYLGSNMAMGIDKYIASSKLDNLKTEASEPGLKILNIECKVNSIIQIGNVEVSHGDDLTIMMDIVTERTFSWLKLALVISDQDLKNLIVIRAESNLSKMSNIFRLEVEIPKIPLTTGFYDLAASFNESVSHDGINTNYVLAHYKSLMRIRVMAEENLAPTPILLHGRMIFKDINPNYALEIFPHKKKE